MCTSVRYAASPRAQVTPIHDKFCADQTRPDLQDFGQNLEALLRVFSLVRLPEKLRDQGANLKHKLRPHQQLETQVSRDGTTV